MLENCNFNDDNLNFFDDSLPEYDSNLCSNYSNRFKFDEQEIDYSHNKFDIIRMNLEINSKINESKISLKYKTFYINLFNKYFKYFYDINFSDFTSHPIENFEIRKSEALFPNNFYFYFKFILKYKNQYLKRLCYFTLNILKKIRKEPELDYTGIHFPKIKKIIKKQISYEKIKLFTTYLYSHNDFKNLLIFEMIYKFNAHIGGIAKMSLNDISNGYITIHSKQKGDFIYKDIKCYKRLKNYISEKQLNNHNFIFIEKNDKNNLKTSINKINKNFNKLVKNSDIFSDINGIKKTSEIFRIPNFVDCNTIIGNNNLFKNSGLKQTKTNFLMEKRKKIYNKIYNEVLASFK